MKNIILIALLIVASWYGYSEYQRRTLASADVPEEVASALGPRSNPEVRFQCDGRTHCSQMTSCAEATYFLQNCPGTKMDGNNDGVPCEKQWCR